MIEVKCERRGHVSQINYFEIDFSEGQGSVEVCTRCAEDVTAVKAIVLLEINNYWFMS